MKTRTYPIIPSRRILMVMVLVLIAISLNGQMLAPTPPMGWNSWNCFEVNINETLIKEIADAMVTSGMRDAGYEYLVLDDGWMAPDRDASGRLQGDPEKFPGGMKALGDYIHSKGLKFGIYECRGYLTCQRLPGSFEHEEIDMATFAEWGVDYIKLDACYAEKNGRLTTEDLAIYRDAIAKTGRPMILSISDFGNGAWAWGGSEYGQLWRTSYDIYPWIENVYHHAATSGGDLRIHPAFNGLWQFAGPGRWNDPDMLEVGNLASEIQDKVHMSLWCILAAPLMAGNDLRTMSDTVTAVLTASEVLAVNQDSRGVQGYRVFDNGKQIIYNKPLSDGTTTVLLYNTDSVPADITVRWEQIGLSGNQPVRDLWARKNLGRFKDQFTALQVPEHGHFLLKIGKKRDELLPLPEAVPEEKYIPSADGFTYLSDLYYIMKYGQAPGYDQTPKGTPISLDEKKYGKGISFSDGTILLYKLKGNATKFRAFVGLDDSCHDTLTGRFRVLNEDAFGNQVLFDSGVMTKDSAAKQINIEVKGMDCLFLKFDGKAAIGNWAQARVAGSWDGVPVTFETSYVDSLIRQMELIPIQINGDKNNRINIVIINRWEARDARPYKGSEMRDEFIDDINKSLLAAFTPGHPDAHTRYANYHKFFNLYALWWPDAPEWRTGNMDSELVDAVRDRLFLPWSDPYTGWVTILMMPNRDGGGGGAARNLEARTGNAVIVGNHIGKMLHEISHTCSSIGDEYTAAATGTDAVPVYTTSLEYERNKIPWRAWIDSTTPLPTPYTEEYRDKIGAFEGSQYHLTNYFRSTAQGCLMGAGVFDNTEEMCPICGQRISMRVYTLVYPIEQAYPAEDSLSFDSSATQLFRVSRVSPVPDTQETCWTLNGKVIARNTDEVRLSFDPDKTYELVFSLRDTTGFIREDPPYGEFPYREKRWFINANKKPEVIILTYPLLKKQPGQRLEAESAEFKYSPHAIQPYFGASKQRFLKLGGEVDKVGWTLAVTQAGWYDLQMVYASGRKGDNRLDVYLNDDLLKSGIVCHETRPLYTGWADVILPVYLKQGSHTVSFATVDSSLVHIDYIRFSENPGSETVVVSQPLTFDPGEIRLKHLKSGEVKILNPLKELEYQWYDEDVPVFVSEQAAEPLVTGTTFYPETKGNYYVGARDPRNGAISEQRRGFYYSPELEVSRAKPMSPDKAKSAGLLLWLDASDLNADGVTDNPAPSRDPYSAWKDKATGMKGPFMLFKPNSLNNMGVAGFEMVWVTNLEKAVSGYQTVFMVFKESSMSFPETAPFKAFNKLLNLQSYPPDKDYHLLVKEFDHPQKTEIRTTEGLWEGSLAELIVYDGKLSPKERDAIKAGLQKKWFSIR